MQSARCAWEVVAGVAPGKPMPEYTKRFVLTSDEWYGEDGELTEGGINRFMELQGTAMMHALGLMNPQQVNWVRLVWVWS
jgi:hypothetical protein